jgi:hypothetical protein
VEIYISKASGVFVGIDVDRNLNLFSMEGKITYRCWEPLLSWHGAPSDCGWRTELTDMEGKSKSKVVPVLS